MTTRAEHLGWCKRRAFEYLDHGDIRNGWMSFLSDMHKHPETQDHMALTMGVMLMTSGGLKTEKEMREFIDGFN